MKVEDLLNEGDLGEAYVEVTNAELDSRFLVEKDGDRIRSVLFAAKNYGRDKRRQLFIRVKRVAKEESLLDMSGEVKFRGRLAREFRLTPEQEDEFEAHFGPIDATKMLLLEAR